MSDQSHQAWTWTGRRVLVALWVVDCVALGVLSIVPVSTGSLRLLTLANLLFLWIFTILLLRRRRMIAFAIGALGIAAGVFLLLPGKSVNAGRLRAEYVKQLRQYEGAPYVWGGESGWGIDCSGLVRRGLINANLRIGLAMANPQALRAALDLWWHDCSALALRDEYRGLTMLVFSADSINDIPASDLLPGDIAVTANGLHVLAYVGNEEWIQAEPNRGCVFTLKIPHDNIWFNQSLRIMRWRQLGDGAAHVEAQE